MLAVGVTLGVTVCVRSALGSSVISVLPYVFEQAGALGHVPALTIGGYTMIANALFVLGQVAILRRQFEPVQLLQVLLGFVFGMLIDLNMMLTPWLVSGNLWLQVTTQLLGCTLLGCGIAMEVRCGSITMPGEGLPVALSRVTGKEFPKMKMAVDCTLVALGVAACYAFFGAWQWHIVGVGTLLAMFYVGMVVKAAAPHMGWFERLLAYRPGFRRYLYGLARYLYRPRP